MLIATLDKVGISATIPCVPEDFVAISIAIVDKSVEGRLKSIRNTMTVGKNPPENREQLQKSSLNVKLLYATGPRFFLCPMFVTYRISHLSLKENYLKLKYGVNQEVENGKTPSFRTFSHVKLLIIGSKRVTIPEQDTDQVRRYHNRCLEKQYRVNSMLKPRCTY